MQFTERDFQILQTVYRYEGVLSVDQIHRWFFGVKRRAYYRIQALVKAKCLQRLPVKDLYRVPEPIVWLDKMGAQVLANYLGVELSELKWRFEPRWSRVSHDLALNEARHMLEDAFQQSANYTLEVWHNQDELERLFTSPIPYLDPYGEKKEKLVKPDGYFCMRVLGEPSYLMRFFVELDNNSESNRRFGRDKVAPTIHLLHSPDYQRELGGKSGQILVVTVGSETRFHNLRSEVKQAGGARYFLFTRSEWLQPETVLTERIFYLAHTDRPFSFGDYHNANFQVSLQLSLADAPKLKTLY
jgi:hypothetical protein